ncbi:flagellar filament capping protein FliD [Geodermatophilus sp. SYSU D00815]
MATASISGLISGLDTATLVSQLMQLEAQPQTLLKSKLADTQDDAAAYRDINTKFDALRTAAEALGKAATWSAAKASSSSAGVVATASATATSGSLLFDVKELAASHSVLSTATWANATDAAGLGSPLTLTKNGTTTSIALKDGATLNDAVTAINAANAGVSAAAVKTTTGYRLQLTSTTSGAGSTFTVAPSGGTTSAFPVLTQGADARIHVGPATGGYDAVSSTNTFGELMPGTSVTVNQTGTATVTVTSDPDAVAAAVQNLVTAANNALSTVAEHTDSSSGSTAVLKGDTVLQSLTGKVLDAVAYAVGADGSAATAGLQLTKDGQIAFDKTAFVAKLKSDPALVQRLVDGRAAADPDGVAGNSDDVTAVPGVAQRLLAVAKAATDSTTGTLTLLAKSEDSLAEDIQDQIEAWNLRLEKRQATLTAQFTAMETVLSTLQSQSSWLSAQLSSLPTRSSKS